MSMSTKLKHNLYILKIQNVTTKNNFKKMTQNETRYYKPTKYSKNCDKKNWLV